MGDQHQVPCIHTPAIRLIQDDHRELAKQVAEIAGTQREVVAELGLQDSDRNGHSVLGRLTAGEGRDAEMAKAIGQIQESILTKDVMEKTIKRAAAWVVGAIAFVGGPPAIIATVKMLWVAKP